jgi:hypothetical protein
LRHNRVILAFSSRNWGEPRKPLKEYAFPVFIPTEQFSSTHAGLTTSLTSSVTQFDVLCELEGHTPRIKRSESQSVNASESSEINNSPKVTSITPTCLRNVILRQ